MSTPCTYTHEENGKLCGTPTLLLILGEPRCTDHNPFVVDIDRSQLDALNAYLRSRSSEAG